MGWWAAGRTLCGAFTMLLVGASDTARAQATERMPQFEDAPVLVLDVRSSEGDDVLARLLTDALRGAVSRATGLREPDRHVSVDVAETLADCREGDAACAAHALGREVGADRVLFGRIRRLDPGRDDALAVTLYLYSVRDRQFEAQVQRRIRHERGRGLDERAAEYLAALVPGTRAAAPSPAELAAVAVTPADPLTADTPRIERSRRLRRIGGALMVAGAITSAALYAGTIVAAERQGAGASLVSGLGFGAGAVTGAAGIAVLAAGIGTGGEEEKRSLRAAATVGPGGGVVQGSVSF